MKGEILNHPPSLCPPLSSTAEISRDYKFWFNDSLENEQIFADTFITSRILLIRGFSRLHSWRGRGGASLKFW